MSLPMSEEQFAFVIWSNEYLDWDNYQDAFEEDYSGLSDDEKYQLMCDLNNDYLDVLEAHGLHAVGINPDRNLVEAVELENHPWFVGVQFHPEFKSRPNRPHPLFQGLIGAALKKQEAE